MPPLCAYCVVEAEVDGVKGEDILKKGMERVERYDGGVTRCRLEEKDRPLRAGLDGITDEDGHTQLRLDFSVPANSTIWVDIIDPINGPSFTPNPLKPMPWFMTRPLTPGMNALRRPSALDRYLHSPSPLSLSSPSATSTVCPSRSPTPVAAPFEKRPVTPFDMSESVDSTASSRSLETKRQRTFSMIREEPLLRPSSRREMKPRCTGSDSDEYSTAMEWPQVSLDAMLCDRATSSTLPGHARRPEDSRLGSVSPEQSTEYLQRYQKAGRRHRDEVEEGEGEDAGCSRGKKKRSVGAELRRLFMGR